MGVQLTLFQPRGADNFQHITYCPPGFEKLMASLRDINPWFWGFPYLSRFFFVPWKTNALEKSTKCHVHYLLLRLDGNYIHTVVKNVKKYYKLQKTNKESGLTFKHFLVASYLKYTIIVWIYPWNFTFLFNNIAIKRCSGKVATVKLLWW